MLEHDELIWKRIYRNGKICSNDLERMLKVTKVHASRLIKSFLTNNSNKVYKKGRFILLYPQATVPDSILNNDLINQTFISGIFEEEFPLLERSISQHKKIDVFLITIMKAIKNSKSIDIAYVSLTYKNSPNEKEKPRTIFPLAFHFFDGAWYVFAVDMKDGQNEKTKMFALNRIQHMQISEEKYRPKNINYKKKIRFILIFNLAFSEEQKNVIIDELGLKKYDNQQYFIDVFEYDLFSFKRKYLSKEKPTSDSNSIYPFFTSYTEQSI